MTDASRMAAEQAILIFNSAFGTQQESATEVDLLDCCRRITLRVTLQIFFAISLPEDLSLVSSGSVLPPGNSDADSNLPQDSLTEDRLVAAICAYFKAWEYFLMRPEWAFDAQAAPHHAAVLRLQRYTRELLAIAKHKVLVGIASDQGSSPTAHRGQFVRSLLALHSSVPPSDASDSDVNRSAEQLALEMLLAGTDTSSVTMLYSALGLNDTAYNLCTGNATASDSHSDSAAAATGVGSVQQQQQQPEATTPGYACRLALQLSTLHACSVNEQTLCESPDAVEDDAWPQALLARAYESAGNQSRLLKKLVFEALRFKPVGPIVIRQALQADTLPTGTTLAAGDGIIINLELVHGQLPALVSAGVSDAALFDPDRFGSDSETSDLTAVPNFYPFGKGSKACVGQHLGLCEVYSVLAVLLNRFEITSHTPGVFREPASPSHQPALPSLSSLDTRWDIANQPVKPVCMRIRRRHVGVVLCGSSSSGKTTLRTALQQRPAMAGLAPIGELARTIMEENKWTRETLQAEGWGLFVRLQEMILHRQDSIEQKCVAQQQGFVSDRGLDPLMYLATCRGVTDRARDWRAWKDTPCLQSLIARHRRCLVVLLEPVEKLLKDDNERIVPTIAEAQLQTEQLKSILDELGIPFYCIPSSLPLHARVPFIEALF